VAGPPSSDALNPFPFTLDKWSLEARRALQTLKDAMLQTGRRSAAG